MHCSPVGVFYLVSLKIKCESLHPEICHRQMATGYRCGFGQIDSPANHLRTGRIT